MAAAGDRALYNEQAVVAGRSLVAVLGTRLDLARSVMTEMGAVDAARVEAPLEQGRLQPESG